MSFFPQAGGVPQQIFLREKETPQLCQGVLDLDKGLRVGNYRNEIVYIDGDTLDYDKVVMGNVRLWRIPLEPVQDPPVVIEPSEVYRYTKCSYSSNLYLNGFPISMINNFSVFTQPYSALLSDSLPIRVQNFIPFYTISAGQDGNSPKIKFRANYNPPILEDGYILPDIQPNAIFLRFLIIKTIPVPRYLAEKKEEPKNINPRAIRG
jgi:hypothetical protein